MIKKIYTRYGELIRYGIAGVTTSLLNFGIFTFLINVSEFNDIAANMIAIPLSIIYAFFVNRYFVFKTHKTESSAIKEFLKFIPARLISWGIELLCYTIIMAVVKNESISKIGSQAAAIIANYIFSKLLVFKK